MVPCVAMTVEGTIKLDVHVALVTDHVADAEHTAVPDPVAPTAALVTDMDAEGFASDTEAEQKLEGPQETVPAAQLGAEATLMTTYMLVAFKPPGVAE